jgi:PAS domain-containing protein
VPQATSKSGLSRLHDTTLAVVRDIGAERQELLDLTAQRAFVRQVLDLVPNMIFAKDREGRFTIANRAVAAVYGVTPSQLVGKTDAAFQHRRRGGRALPPRRPRSDGLAPAEVDP